MSLIDIRNLTFGYDGGFENVFENVSLQIDTDWKTGLIGRNGRGKTTLLKLLTGKYDYLGKISSNVKFTYFPFSVKNEYRPSLEIIREVCAEADEWQIVRELSLLQTDTEILDRPFSSLSNGERTKLLLAGLFLNENEFLLIDEPTNHLDLAARKQVSAYLRSKKGFILVSHDRAFLDGCIDHIISINKTGIEVASGNFSSWFTNFEKRQAYENAQNERLKKDIERLSEAAKRTAVWADKTEASKYGKNDSGLKSDRGFVGHKAAKLMKQAKVTEARKQRAKEQKSELLKDMETSERLKLYPLEYRADRVASFKNVEIFYGERKICEPVSFDIKKGDRIALDGKNGSGKSSLLKLIVGEKISYCGDFTLSSGLIVSYVPQTSEVVVGRLNEFAKENKIDESLFFTILSKMDISGKDFGRDMRDFSEGQKKKVFLAKSLCESAHLYVWDEPFNYIDLYSRLQVENLISEFKPTMIFVEHDKAFREKIATDIIKI